MPYTPVTLYTAAAVRDAAGLDARPGAVAVLRGRVLAAGRVEPVTKRAHRRRPDGRKPEVRRVDLPDRLIIPALVNAHAHLDLTHLGPLPYQGDFADWIARVIRHRRDRAADAAAAVRAGLDASFASGVGVIGDVAYSPDAIRARLEWKPKPPPTSDPRLQGTLPGVSYLECFGFDSRAEQVFDELEQKLDKLPFETPVPGHERGLVVGVSPHAPYTVGRRLYELVTHESQFHAYRLCTHLAESDAELQFVRDASGPLAEMLRRVGAWDDSIKPTGQHPIDWLQRPLHDGRWMAIHCNIVGDDHIQMLKRFRVSVAYCPIASDYFGYPAQGPHRYRDMLAAGVNVCLGTDSIACQPTDEPQPLGILPQMRHLYRRDQTDPALLLKMATINGMLALELDEHDATFRRNSPADLIAIPIDPDNSADPLKQAMQSTAPAERIC